MRTSLSAITLILCALSACGSGDAPSGGLTPDQNKTLESAAQKLDAQRADLPKRDGAQPPAKAEVAPATAKPKPQPAQ
jgi:hypothetical protein